MPILQRECGECSTKYALLELGGKTTALDQPEDGDIFELGCPACGSQEAVAVVGGGSGIWLGGEGGVGRHYPYQDRVLGVTVNSAQHRRELLAERGLEATDGDFDYVGEAERRFEDEARMRAEHEEEKDYQMNGPNRAEYRKALEIISRDGAKLFGRR